MPAAGRRCVRSAKGSTDDELRLLLKAPVAVAWWITTFAPELLERDHLDLLMIGVPGGPSAADEGRPYQLLPLLLERPKLTVDATVMLWTPEARFAPRPHYSTPHISLDGQPGSRRSPRDAREGSLAQWLEDRDGKATGPVHADASRASTSGNRCGRGCARCSKTGAHVGCFARGMEKVERDAWLLQAHGYEVSPDAQRNPWSRYHPELRGHGSWAAVGWRFKPRSLPPADFAVDVARLRRAHDAQEFLQHEFEVWNPLQFIGRAQPAEGDTSPIPSCSSACPTITRSRFGRARSGRSSPTSACASKGNIALPPEVLATYPGEKATAFERLLWAVDIYRGDIRRREVVAMQMHSATQIEHVKTQVALSLKGKASRAEIDAFTEYFRGGMSPGAATPGSEGLFKALRIHNWDEAAALIAATPVARQRGGRGWHDALVLRVQGWPLRARPPLARDRRESEPSRSRGVRRHPRCGQARRRGAGGALASLRRRPRSRHRDGLHPCPARDALRLLERPRVSCSSSVSICTAPCSRVRPLQTNTSTSRDCRASCARRSSSSSASGA